MKLKNSRKRYYTILGSGMLLLCLSGCGNAAEINAEADSTVDMVAEEDMESKSESVLEENVQIQSDDTEAEQEETATENADELKTEDLQSIIDSYDNVLSIENSAAGVVPIFGYHIPEGWERDNSYIDCSEDGKKKEKHHDRLIRYGDDAHTPELSESIWWKCY